MNEIDIKSMTLHELSSALDSFELPHYRISQLYGWLHKDGVNSFDEMNNMPKKLRSLFAKNFTVARCDIVNKQISYKDNTVKYLFSLTDGELIESVLMHYKYGYSLCVSTQVGCKMGCKFCATAIGGFVRDLSASEMLGQIHSVQRDMSIRISHLVLMGMGEPLDNFANVSRFIDLASNRDGLNIGMRNISISTCGVVPGIYKLMEKELQLTLSVSIHAPNDEIRLSLMPVNNKYPLADLLAACKSYSINTARRISFEYALFEGINDSVECAYELCEQIKGIHCHVNLIPGNSIDNRGFRRADSESIKKFETVLKNKRINVTVRRSLGSDIDAACGQLRRRNLDKIH